MATRERPILFSAPMVRAILEGRKSQTRRVVTKDPDLLNYAPNQCFMDGAWYPTTPSGKIGMAPGIVCPYGKPGDLLWVRETAFPDFPKDFTYYDWTWAEVPEEYRTPKYVLYNATSPDYKLKWKPSIHMPRWASRLTLRITDVRVERVQSISEADAVAEGVDGKATLSDGVQIGGGIYTARNAYATLWDSINGKKPGASWADNPWVWVVSFEREEAPYAS